MKSTFLEILGTLLPMVSAKLVSEYSTQFIVNETLLMCLLFDFRFKPTGNLENSCKLTLESRLS